MSLPDYEADADSDRSSEDEETLDSPSPEDVLAENSTADEL
jgi:hypothetical protein